MQLAEDIRLVDLPKFGSEPYLISIGPRVSISNDVTFVTHDGGTRVFREREPYRNVRKFGRITIKENCFIGCWAILMPGITIGPNSVVAAGAVVFGDVPPDTVVWGNPARALMNIETYAEQTADKNLDWDEERYRADKKAEILRQCPYPW